jgi:hypothetical protein
MCQNIIMNMLIMSPLVLSSAFVINNSFPPSSALKLISYENNVFVEKQKVLQTTKYRSLKRERTFTSKSSSSSSSTSLSLFERLTEIGLKNSADEDNAKDAEKLKSFKDDIETKISYDRSYENMGILMPLAEKLDAVSGDWALSYADLSPATPKTPAGVSFLLTNVCYAYAGIVLISQGDFFYGSLVELAGAVSFWYHYSQLEFGKDRSEVRLALLTDYFTAGSALLTGGFYMVQMGITSVPIDALIVGGGAILALSLCWVWEFGYPYLVLHSIWHILSAYTGYLIGQARIDSMV